MFYSLYTHTVNRNVPRVLGGGGDLISGERKNLGQRGRERGRVKWNILQERHVRNGAADGRRL